MAKNPDHLADGFDTDNTGGVLSGLLAEEDELDRRALWRLGSWGVGATGAVVVAVMANQSSLGWKRDQMAAADLTQQAQQIQTVARDSQNEARRLASAIDTLNGDRDRLYSRVTGWNRAWIPSPARSPGRVPHRLHRPPPPSRKLPRPARPGRCAGRDDPGRRAAESPRQRRGTGPATVSSVAKDAAKTTSQSRMPPRSTPEKPPRPSCQG